MYFPLSVSSTADMDNSFPKWSSFTRWGSLSPIFIHVMFGVGLWHETTRYETINMMVCIVIMWWYSMYTYYPCGIHSSCSFSPFSSTFNVWTPEGSSRPAILTAGASAVLNIEKESSSVRCIILINGQHKFIVNLQAFLCNNYPAWSHDKIRCVIITHWRRRCQQIHCQLSLEQKQTTVRKIAVVMVCLHWHVLLNLRVITEFPGT